MQCENRKTRQNNIDEQINTYIVSSMKKAIKNVPHHHPPHQSRARQTDRAGVGYHYEHYKAIENSRRVLKSCIQVQRVEDF